VSVPHPSDQASSSSTSSQDKNTTRGGIKAGLETAFNITFSILDIGQSPNPSIMMVWTLSRLERKKNWDPFHARFMSLNIKESFTQTDIDEDDTTNGGTERVMESTLDATPSTFHIEHAPQVDGKDMGRHGKHCQGYSSERDIITA
jgi:hypothetical protein